MLNFIKSAIKVNQESERLLYDICTVTGKTRKEVINYAISKPYSLKQIKKHALTTGVLIE